MLKRIGLFLVTNFLVILTISLIMNILLPALGIKVEGYLGIAVFCGLFGMGGAFISLSISRWMAKRAYNIRLISSTEPDYNLRAIYDMVFRLSRAAGLKVMPEVGIYESPDPNAFATGPSKDSSLVAFSTGLLRSMSPKEVEAVAAHEISHITNGDMVTMTLLTGIANALVMFLARIITFAIDNFLRNDEGEGGLGFFARIFVVMALESVFMLIASIPLAAFSRAREYRADAGAAKLAGSTSMIQALQTLAKASNIPTQSDSFAMSKISSGRRISLWSTHPALEDRIARLSRM
jgi:heat shock protein HtpX